MEKLTRKQKIEFEQTIMQNKQLDELLGGETPPALVWALQKEQYPKTGKAGISYFKGTVEGASYYVDCLCYRDSEGDLKGVLNHFPMDIPPWEKKGNFTLNVDPKCQHKGIATKLLNEGIKRYNLNLAQQTWTKAGRAFVRKFLGLPPVKE